MNEIPAVETWIAQSLLADTALRAIIGRRIYPGQAPQAAGQGRPAPAFPLVEFAQQSPGRDALTSDGLRSMVSPLYRIQAVGRGIGIMALQPLADRIDALFHRQNWPGEDLEAGGHAYYVSGSQRKRAHRPADEIVAGEVYVTLGGLYEVTLTALS